MWLLISHGPVTVKLYSNFSAELKSGVLHLLLVVFIKLFILGDGEMVLPVTNSAWRTTDHPVIGSWSSDDVSCHRNEIITFKNQVTFSQERRNFKLHHRDFGIVDHFIAFHVIKVHTICNFFLLLNWGRQANKAAEFVYFSSSILK